MSTDANKIILIGRLTRDPEKKYTQGGTAITSFSIANNKTYKNQAGEKVDQVSYFNCVAWSGTADLVAEYLHKGNRVYLEGRLVQDRYKDKDGNDKQAIKINVELIQFLENKKQDNSDKKPEDQGNNQPANYGENPFSDEDIPF